MMPQPMGGFGGENMFVFPQPGFGQMDPSLMGGFIPQPSMMDPMYGTFGGFGMQMMMPQYQ
jgi:hypothetical protein